MGVDGTYGLSQIEVGKTYIHLSVYPFRFGFQPCRLCLHHIAQRNHAFLHSQVGIPQVFFSLVYAAQGGLVSLHALLQFLNFFIHQIDIPWKVIAMNGRPCCSISTA